MSQHKKELTFAALQVHHSSGSLLLELSEARQQHEHADYVGDELRHPVHSSQCVLVKKIGLLHPQYTIHCLVQMFSST